MTRQHLVMAAVLTAPLVVTACSGSTSGAQGAASAKGTTSAHGVQQVTIHATNGFRFSPSTVTAHTGKLRITLVDDGSYPHNISFPTMHLTSSTVSGNPGQDTTTLTVALPRAGTYSFFCSFHSSAGMKGQIKVS